MDKAKGALTRRIGFLPLWGWAVAGVAAVFVGLKLRGASGGSGAGPGLVSLPAGSGVGTGGGVASPPIVNPAQNAIGGMDTAPGGMAPWWAPLPGGDIGNISPGSGGPTPGGGNGIGSVGLPHPSTNGSSGSGSLTSPTATAPSASSPSADWWSKLLNPMGNIPAGAAVTTIGGTVYSLSDAALGRAGITGAVPIQNATGPASTNASQTGDPQGNPWISQWGGVGAAAPRTDIGPSLESVYGAAAAAQMRARAAAIENR